MPAISRGPSRPGAGLLKDEGVRFMLPQEREAASPQAIKASELKSRSFKLMDEETESCEVSPTGPWRV